MDLGIKGRRAIVTGGGSGIGYETARLFLEEGVRVLIAGRTKEKIEKARDELAKKTGGEVHAIQADMTREADIKRIVDTAKEKLGGVDILVNNAGIIRRADAVEFSEADWDDVMDVNVKALFFTCQAFAKELLAKGRPGKIVNIASLLSFQGGIRVPSYTASKHGVSGLTKLLANEWGAKSINVNAIAPGYIETNNTEALRDDPDRNKAILDRIPANRWGRPKDIAGAAVFLSSAAADYIHGAILNVDGGWLAR